jgi:hypothetical protein
MSRELRLATIDAVVTSMTPDEVAVTLVLHDLDATGAMMRSIESWESGEQDKLAEWLWPDVELP